MGDNPRGHNLRWERQNWSNFSTSRNTTRGFIFCQAVHHVFKPNFMVTQKQPRIYSDKTTATQTNTPSLRRRFEDIPQDTN